MFLNLLYFSIFYSTFFYIKSYQNYNINIINFIKLLKKEIILQKKILTQFKNINTENKNNNIDFIFIENINNMINDYNKNNINNELQTKIGNNIIEYANLYTNPKLLLLSKNGFSGKCWGPGLWKFLHIVSFNFPLNPTQEQKMIYYQFVQDLGKILPCKICRDNYSTNLKNVDFDIKQFENREIFVQFIFNLHNEVNKKLGKKIIEKQNFLYEICRYPL